MTSRVTVTIEEEGEPTRVWTFYEMDGFEVRTSPVYAYSGGGGDAGRAGAAPANPHHVGVAMSGVAWPDRMLGACYTVDVQP